MKKTLLKLIIPAVLTMFGGIPAAAQIRIGLDLGEVHIRIAPEAPPRLRMERRMPRPSRRHIWIAGYWDRRDEQWAWAPGRWEVPQERGVYWVKPRYRQERGAYRYDPGHWSNQRVVPGEEYSRWQNENRRNRGRHWGNDRDRENSEPRRNH